MIEREKVAADGTRYLETNPFGSHLMSLVELQKLQQRQAEATYGRVALRSGEVKPAKVAKMTADEILDAGEAFIAPIL